MDDTRKGTIHGTPRFTLEQLFKRLEHDGWNVVLTLRHARFERGTFVEYTGHAKHYRAGCVSVFDDVVDQVDGDTAISVMEQIYNRIQEKK